MTAPEPSPADPLLDGILGDGAVLVTGGAGFIGSTLAIDLARASPGARVIAFDNLRRPGSELNLGRLREAGVAFLHGDARLREDLDAVPRPLELIVDCAADPSVLAGYSTPPGGAIGSNLIGTLNCLELARRERAALVFLSTSRVYPIAGLNAIAAIEEETRFTIDPAQDTIGVSPAGVSERFSLEGVRSLYGATKLASELMVQEYASMYGLRTVINRLGVVTGRGQMGKVEQGVFSLWMARHVFGGELTYQGWGGRGKQVRDLIHVQDVCQLVRRQLARWDTVSGRIYNVGGGASGSLSLCETTRLCRELAGRTIPIHPDPRTHPSDVRLYCSDARRVAAEVGWRPAWDPGAILADLFEWLRTEERTLRPIFAGT